MPTRAPSLRSIASTDAAAPDCPRHRRGSPYTRNTDGEYASHVPACTGGDCILGRCDRIRAALRAGDPSTAVLTFQQRRLQEMLEAVPADTAVPQEALHVRALLNATLALDDAYRTWRASGEDTPHTREPLELALRAVEATHDIYTPSTSLYERICTRLDRTRRLPLESASSPSQSPSRSLSPLSATDSEEMRG
jgi:hypothetical protein